MKYMFYYVNKILRGEAMHMLDVVMTNLPCRAMMNATNATEWVTGHVTVQMTGRQAVEDTVVVVVDLAHQGAGGDSCYSNPISQFLEIICKSCKI